MPAPDAPGPFSLADPDRITTILTAAGFANVTITAHEDPVVIPEADIGSLISLSQRVGPVREAFRTVDTDTAARIVDAVRATLAARVEDGQLRLSAAAHIVRADR